MQGLYFLGNYHVSWDVSDYSSSSTATHIDKLIKNDFLRFFVPWSCYMEVITRTS